MAFVPAAPCHLDGYTGALSDCTLERPILVDMFEVTRRDWLHYFPRGAAEGARAFAWQSEVAAFDSDKLDWPVYVSFDEALELGRRRGMRLPTAREWVHVAVGRRSQSYPWGSRPWKSVANTLELGLGSPSAAGAFENGRSLPFGCYDMLGNVWEWVSDRVPGFTDPPLVSPPSPGEGLVSILGGAYNSRGRRTFGSADPSRASAVAFHAATVDRRVVSPSIGARLCADAEEFLWSRSGAAGRAPSARERLEALGARWAAGAGRDYVLPFLDELGGRPGAPAALLWLAQGARGPAGREAR